MRMESTAELILQGHFSKLRDAINKQADAENQEGEVATMLKQVFHYLDVRERKGLLDPEGTKLFQQLAELLDKVNEGHTLDVPGKLPMQKAKGKKNVDSHKKTGT